MFAYITAAYNMLLCTISKRVLLRVMRSTSTVATAQRLLATESRVEDWGFYPDTARRSEAEAKRMMWIDMGVDDAYEPKIVKQTYGSKEQPNLVPIRSERRLIACTCSPAEPQLHYMWLNRGARVQCPCEKWFKAVDPSEMQFEKEAPTYA